MYRYFAIFKPFGMISQFSKEGDHETLADLGFQFPTDVYPLGRLDTDSEGLLLLTNDKRVNAKLLLPENKHNRKYLVQLEGEITSTAIESMKKGVTLNDKGSVYKTRPAEIKIVESPPVPERNPPVRFRKNIPTSWIELVLQEGKNRQVRKMTAAVGFPTLRLIRMEIEGIRLEKFEKGWVKELRKDEFYSFLKLKL
jgi:23S rRNA pseudouridine2457 synthase